jgi:hypothetical protein
MIADSLNILASTISIHLVKKIGLKICSVCWVAHTLSSELRQKRVEFTGHHSAFWNSSKGSAFVALWPVTSHGFCNIIIIGKYGVYW